MTQLNNDNQVAVRPKKTMTIREIYELNPINNKIIKKYNSLSELGRELLNNHFGGTKHFHTILNSIIGAISRRSLYCGKKFMYVTDYDKYTEEANENLKIKIIPNRHNRRNFVGIHDMYREYVRIKKLKNDFYVTKEEFMKVLENYREYLLDKLVEEGILSEEKDTLGIFKLARIDNHAAENSRKNLINFINRENAPANKRYTVTLKWRRPTRTTNEKLFLLKANKKTSNRLLSISDNDALKYNLN